MKKLFLMVSLLLLTREYLGAQTSECHVVIRSNFDSECLFTGYPPIEMKSGEANPHYNAPFDQCFKACMANSVTYWAECADAVRYRWEVSGGDVNPYTLGNQNISVAWKLDNTGTVSVTVYTGAGDSCTATACIELFMPPVIEAVTVPPYIEQNGVKVIEICVGESVAFMDNNTTTSSVTGYFWETTGNTNTTAATPNFMITPDRPGSYKVQHRIRNECGCESSEEFYVNVMDGVAKLELSCHGMACAGSVETYEAYEPQCDSYHWHVEGGVIVSGQFTPEITVQWGNPAAGYGTIALDQRHCNSSCHSLLSVKIPILTDRANITGPDELCVGETQLYELPLWGSSEYNSWKIWPNANVIVSGYHHNSQRLLQFTAPGIYQLTVTYGCEFIDCGTFSTTKAIVVKSLPRITSSSEGEICMGNPVTFTVEPTLNVTWAIFDPSGESIATYYNTPAITHTFDQSGLFTVMAFEYDRFCQVAEYRFRVHPKPPQPTVTGNPIACRGDAVGLHAEGVLGSNTVYWKPVCSTLPDSEGVSYSCIMPAEGCEVFAYQKNEAGCVSDTAVILVESFALRSPPESVTACTYNTLTIDELSQPDVHYTWTVEPANRATLIGSHTSPEVTLYFNYVAGVSYPETAYIKVERTYCSGQTDEQYIPITITHREPPVIILPDGACEGEEVPISADNILPGSTLRWTVNNNIYEGNTITPVFPAAGTYPITLYYSTDELCEELTVTATFTVAALPAGNILPTFRIDTCILSAPSNYVEYEWYREGNLIARGNTCMITPLPHESTTYCCQMTTAGGCVTTKCYTYHYSQGGTECLAVSIEVDTTGCYSYSASIPDSLSHLLFNWSLIPASRDTILSSTGSFFNFTVSEADRYIIHAHAGDYCNRIALSVRYLPRFEITYNPCTDLLTITDRTLDYGASPLLHGYEVRQSNGTVLARIEVQPGTTLTRALPLASGEQIEVRLTYSHNNRSCTLSKTITIPQRPRINETSLNSIPNRICSGTPFQVSVSGTAIDRYTWDFGDGSYARGSTLHHTYANLQPTYNIRVIGWSSFGCADTSATREIAVGANPLANISLLPTTGIEGENCEGETNPEPTIALSMDNSAYTYQWFPAGNQYGAIGLYPNIYHPTRTGYYFARITNADGCIKELQTNAYFKNTPQARISGATTCCAGDSVTLFGGSELYATTWRILRNGTLYAVYEDVTTLSLLLPVGAYTVTLSVLNEETDCYAEDEVTVTVHPVPAAPQLVASGCMYTPPVAVVARNNPNNENLYWSNGIYSPIGSYYTAGWATAYRMDFTSGCKSEKDSIFIVPSPNLEALLTGCYTLCKATISSKLGMYGFAPFIRNYYSWKWYFGGQAIQNGTTTADWLNLLGGGEYYLNVMYDSCQPVQSPNLQLNYKEECYCEKVNVSISESNCRAEECKLIMDFVVKIRNNGSIPFRVTHFTTSSNQDIIPYSWSPDYEVSPGETKAFKFSIEIKDYAADMAEFVIYDAEHRCDKQFAVPLNWEECIKCNRKIKEFNTGFIRNISTLNEASYFDFSVHLPDGVSKVFSMWCDPPIVMEYIFYRPDNIKGTMLFYYGTLTQIYKENICVYVLACTDDQLCLLEYCFMAGNLVNMILRDPPTRSAYSELHNEEEPEEIRPTDVNLYLVPNPAKDQVTVTGIDAASVQHITIFTMDLKQIATFPNTHLFNVGNLAAAVYIVKVVLHDNRVKYLKLVKQ